MYQFLAGGTEAQAASASDTYTFTIDIANHATVYTCKAIHGSDASAASATFVFTSRLQKKKENGLTSMCVKV
jgi:hypothetical protein